MGILRDTYNITKVDMSGVEYQMKRKNDIQEQQNKVINNTKDRVDISLKEYENLKKELELKTKKLNKYEEFVSDLANNIKIRPDVLLKGKAVDNYIERSPHDFSYNLYVEWKFEDRDFIENFCRK